jgi:hypothetical protein
VENEALLPPKLKLQEGLEKGKEKEKVEKADVELINNNAENENNRP